jgi:hypothetical protein
VHDRDGQRAWREHPALRARLHRDHPDDVQVIVHDGGPRITDRRPELVWVRVTGVAADVFSGVVLNQPQQLETLAEGAAIQFVVPAGGEHPLLVTAAYLAERGSWTIHPCAECGLTELFDAPSRLIRQIFPSLPADATMDAFTAFCGACGGVQSVERKRSDEDESPAHHERPWWKFWK